MSFLASSWEGGHDFRFGKRYHNLDDLLESYSGTFKIMDTLGTHLLDVVLHRV